ncbi:D-serine ammonia-lyase [Sphingomonas sp.]|uniref:D-serine ammonia-lyase n=1 Tax=Sphingomonas sp. TaxID=28214 RepID=UPI0025E6085A|nr:D-serine ammonia-lyase [Sphingomonas sp.]
MIGQAAGPIDEGAAPFPRSLREGRQTVWLRPAISRSSEVREIVSSAEVEAAVQRFRRFEPVLAGLFGEQEWDGRVRSALIPLSADRHWVKGDHALPMTGSIKARGGVHEVLRLVEERARAQGLLGGDDYRCLLDAGSRSAMAGRKVVVASTGNLGYSVGLVARAFGLRAEIHMSRDAKLWKKEALRAVGATVVEHDCDYTSTVARARAAAATDDAHFIDDERSRDLMTGYAAAGVELEEQLLGAGLEIGPARPLVVYLPCGVGGAPGGITLGLKRRFGDSVITVFVEPVASACVMAAMIQGGCEPVDVASYGGNNDTIADGLAVGRASDLMLSACGNLVDAVVAVTDQDMIMAMRDAWLTYGLRFEPSAAASMAAHSPLMASAARSHGWPDLAHAHHLFWATGGSRLPADEFSALLAR